MLEPTIRQLQLTIFYGASAIVLLLGIGGLLGATGVIDADVLVLLLVVLGIVALTLTLMFVRWAAGTVRRPLGDLEQMAQRLAAGDHSARVVPRGAKDVQVVARALNRLADESERARDVEQGVHRQLLDLDRTREEFISNVSHELRTPLTNIVGYLEVLEGETVELEAEERRRILDAAQRNVVRLRELIEDLLYLNKTEAATERRTDVDLARLVEEVATDLELTARKRGVLVRTSVPGDPVLVSADPSDLQRVVLNLMSNAVKFSRDGGAVDIELTEADARARLRVRDQGIGVPASELADLGGRFFRASNAVQHEIAGTGLGLRIVQTILAKLGGSIDFASVEGQGTTATVTLPVVAVAEP